MDEESSRDDESIKWVPEPETLSEAETKPLRRALFHPFKCRLGDTAGIETSSATCMTQIGFACWSIGMVTLFRPSFVLLISILDRIDVSASRAHFKKTATVVSYSWFILVLFVFFVLGWIPMFASWIKKRWVLIVHPWALLLLYFDFIVWLTISIMLHVEVCTVSPSEGTKYVAYFVIIYLDIMVYFIIYYIYVTYYIVAELTIIQKFY